MSRTENIDILDVQRINVREPDGTLRYVLTNGALFPGIIMRGVEYTHASRQAAGMLFFNDEGSEMGGLLFDGKEGASGGSLTFDAFENDQLVQVTSQQGSDGSTMVGLIVSDRPARSMIPDLQAQDGLSAEEQQALAEKNLETDPDYYGAPRIVVAKFREGSAIIQLRDKRGNTRLRFKVTEDGEAAIEFLDADGTVKKAITAD